MQSRAKTGVVFTDIGVMMASAVLELSSNTPFRIVSSWSTRGPAPSPWNDKRDLEGIRRVYHPRETNLCLARKTHLSSAFLYVCDSLLPSTQSSSLAIGHAIGAWHKTSREYCEDSITDHLAHQAYTSSPKLWAHNVRQCGDHIERRLLEELPCMKRLAVEDTIGHYVKKHRTL